VIFYPRHDGAETRTDPPFKEQVVRDAAFVVHAILAHGGDWRDCSATSCTGVKDYMRRVLGRDP
jgi:hypothetical protein